MIEPQTRPVILDIDTIRAIRGGQLTFWHLPMKPQPPEGADYSFSPSGPDGEMVDGNDYIKSPYGRPGDQLWIREECRYQETSIHMGVETGVVEYRDGTTRAVEVDAKPNYTAYREFAGCATDPPRWRAAVRMPRWASRLTVELTCNCAERLESGLWVYVVHFEVMQVWR